jgi:DNA-binding MarR family transcriptional regulator
VPFEAALTELSQMPVYQAIAEQAAHLHLLGMNPNRIAVHLGVDRTTVTRALRWIKSH